MRHTRTFALAIAGSLAAGACGSGSDDAPEARTAQAPPVEQVVERTQPATPANLPQALVLGLAHFAPRAEGGKPLPARLEFLRRTGGEWVVSTLDDDHSNVFHKGMAYTMPDGSQRLLSIAGVAATVKLWSPGETAPTATTLWEKNFGELSSRMRDVEVADLYGDGRLTLAVATHSQGVVATLRPPDAVGGEFEVIELDAEKDTIVHEIEIGDLDGDGVLEVYATPSAPNKLDGTPQAGVVVRYVPATGEGRVVVADLGDRHAKEILVADVDGDGRDELYVVVEGKMRKGTQTLEYGVEIRRYDAGTDPSQGVVIGELRDQLCRFLTVGDADGDGNLEMVAAAFSSGLWLLRPGSEPGADWQIQSIDTDSGGFEHASIFADLDGDGLDELYVASDKHNEVRRYVWHEGAFSRETIYKRTDGRSVFTWNAMPIPVELVP